MVALNSEYVYVTGLRLEEQIGLILLDALSELNITLNLQPLVWPDMVARATEVETAPHIMAVYSGTSYGDPDNFLWQAYHSSQAGFWRSLTLHEPGLRQVARRRASDTGP
ncbi:MAG: hypothetical protein R2849_13565 [Thermomicrobiales bacterium]